MIISGLINYRTFPYKGHKIYLKILQLAKMYGELNVVTALEVLLEKKIEPIIDHITDLLNSQTQTVCSVKINQPILSEYDQL
ncbi:hypothetical protein [Rickettsia endosymbiont of Urophora cardui]|uniref:hypothetical protein n=1 Tax=Rickettsia endosymbiont of Urophora cardui TaxID=3066265 RepID=UPI00313ED4E5